MTCLLCQAGSYVYQTRDCAGCVARWISRMPERDRIRALSNQEPSIRAAVEALLERDAMGGRE